jgi:ATP-dependent exoDNAse (exonuclease V) beta subunit
VTDPIEADAAARQIALDPRRSCIVQAPAGSGKTELLIQRYLVLLGLAQVPEEIIAVTFTRKAAGEMRNRVVEALAYAAEPLPPQPHRRLTAQLARRIADHDRRQGWRLLEHPLRMRILTIDAWCAELTRQMPWLSAFGAQPTIAGDAQPLYREAARCLLAQRESAGPWARAIVHLLVHLDNDLQRVEDLIVTLLGRRDQWLRHLIGLTGPQRRRRLETTLAAVVSEGLAAANRGFPAARLEGLVGLARWAAANLARSGVEHPLRVWEHREFGPGTAAQDLDAWRALIELLLTRTGEWRKQVNTTLGFPPPSATRDPTEKVQRQAQKATFEALIGSLRGDAALRQSLAALRTLPPSRYGDAQWALVEALAELLPVAAAELRLVFQRSGQVDFTEVSQGALHALGAVDEPTDLALALDHRIQHILVDEFQDTSHGQYRLLERLTAGWERGDGRTLFLVGDPMQSIYRFREAEVGLFLQARREGLGGIELTPLNLSRNFRSAAALVEWVNRAFARAMPAVEDPATGAVAYSPAVAAVDPVATPAVTIHPAFSSDTELEAQRVRAIVDQEREIDPAGSIVVLVRSRSHLVDLLPVLNEAGLAFMAIDIEALGERPAVQDLLSLTKALWHPADRLAWLAVLRAPWCGLSLADLHDLVVGSSLPVPALLAEAERRRRLSAPAQGRVARVWPVLAQALAHRRRGPLRRRVEAVWHALGGPATVDGKGLAAAEVFLDLVEELDQDGWSGDLMELDRRVAALYAPPNPAAADSLQVMTIHKAKGLEFDTVIVPGLGRGPASDPPRLLAWMERVDLPGADGLLLAPIKGVGEAGDPVYEYLREVERERGQHEDGRLLYVAATRARRRLHLLGHSKLKATDAGAVLHRPLEGSLLARLWETVAGDFDRAATEGSAPARPPPATTGAPARALRRLAPGWTLPAPPAGLTPTGPAPQAMTEPVEFLWAGATARSVGSLVHRYLQVIGEEGLGHWHSTGIAARVPVFAAALRQEGVPEAEIGPAVERVRAALSGTLADPRGRWILASHRDARCEYRISGVVAGRVVHAVIDRTFIDADGTRWIVDYKTGVHEGGSSEAFLDREADRYQGQLRRYAHLMAGLEDRPVRLGLYFPLLQAWREPAIDPAEALADDPIGR